ncbi:endonuclease I family protein [Myroides sp. LoEW2-1]|nr:endonuclease [Myroides sp. LoEW2-1]
MKKASFFLALGMAMAIFSCSKDPIVTDPTRPDTEEPSKPTDPTGPTEPSKPQPDGDAGIDINKPETVADFNNPTEFLKSLNKFKLATYAKVVTGQGKDGGNALQINGTPEANGYVFTTENQTVAANAKSITFYIKGTADKSLSFNVYTNAGYEVFNLRTDEQIASKTDITLSSDLILKKTNKKQESDSNIGVNDYVGVKINANNWIKITLDISDVDYNKSKTGSVFGFKVGSKAAYNLLVSSIVFDDAKPTTPVDPVDPDPVDPGTGQSGDFKNIPADQKAYYANIDFKKTGMELKVALAKLIQKKNDISYTANKHAIAITDRSPDGKLYMIYGEKGTTSGNHTYTSNSGWNREHVFAQSQGNPVLGRSKGPGVDAHHLRPSIIKHNSDRGNLHFIEGSGKARKLGGGWYPGDEWRGDVARMMMYMYLVYDQQCDANLIAISSPVSTDKGMVELFLKWNAEDPVADLEIQRNDFHGNPKNANSQGNRNPFIDNPYLATQIWGGPVAENRWK